MSASEALERQHAWRDEWEARHAKNWLENFNGLLYPATQAQPIVAAIVSEPHSAPVIRDLELFLNGRVLSPAPKERP